MGYIRDRKTRKKRLRKWVRKFIKWGLIIAFVAFLLWWLLHMLGDMHGMIVGLEDEVNRQHLEINNLHNQLQESLTENRQMEVKINGLHQYIIDQNNAIHDLRDQLNPNDNFQAPDSKLNVPDVSNKPAPTPDHNIGKDLIKHPNWVLFPVLIGALESGFKILSPKLIFGGI